MNHTKEYARALANIMEKAKSQRDLSVHPESARWDEIVQIAYYALGRPDMAEVERIRDTRD